MAIVDAMSIKETREMLESVWQQWNLARHNYPDPEPTSSGKVDVIMHLDEDTGKVYKIDKLYLHSSS